MHWQLLHLLRREHDQIRFAVKAPSVPDLDVNNLTAEIERNAEARLATDKGLPALRRSQAEYADLTRRREVLAAKINTMRAKAHELEAERPDGVAALLVELDGQVTAAAEELRQHDAQIARLKPIVEGAEKRIGGIASSAVAKASGHVADALRARRGAVVERIVKALQPHLPELFLLDMQIGIIEGRGQNAGVVNRLVKGAAWSPQQADADELEGLAVI